MSPLMIVIIRFDRKLLGTILASVRFLTCVSPVMHDHVLFVSGGLLTDRALVLSRIIKVTNFHMHVQTVLSRITLSAIVEAAIVLLRGTLLRVLWGNGGCMLHLL